MVISKKVIKGCEHDPDYAGVPYMTRYTFPRLGPIRPVLHVFHRSDGREMHDHPWPFVSIILWRGYVEETPHPLTALGRRRKRVWPGMILFRRATHVHRVELVDEKPAVTLVIMGKRCREWGFFTDKGWQNFKAFFKERGC